MWLPTENLGGCPYPGHGGTQELQTDNPAGHLYPADSCNAVASPRTCEDVLTLGMMV